MNRLLPSHSFPLLGAALILTACILVPKRPASLPPSPVLTVSSIPIPTAMLTNLPVVPDELLPHALYYQSQGQVFRMEQDGQTITQLTFETVDVAGYDVSLVDGSMVYVAGNQLALVNADGSNRRVLVEGGSRDEANPAFFKDPLTDPVFSPDGQTLAYAHGHKGLYLYDISSGRSELAIEDQWTDPGPDGMQIPIETYSPVDYSPDGTKLLVALGHWESPPSHAVYHLDTNALVRYAGVQDYINCCSYHGGPVWSLDSSSFYGVASIHDTCCLFGELWRVDATNGAVTRMFRVGAGTAKLPNEPYLAPDGQLYFFFGTYQVDSGYWDVPVLELVRSAPDDVTHRTVRREENFILMREALWAPDASFVIVSAWPARNWNQEGGVLELYYTDGQTSAVWLAPLGHDLKWGP